MTSSTLYTVRLIKGGYDVQWRSYFGSCGHDRAVGRGAELLQRAVKDADRIVKVHGVHSQPLVEILPRRQAHRLPDVALAQSCIDVAFEGQSLREAASTGALISFDSDLRC